MDALSDVLKSVRLEGAVYINAEFTAPWCVQAKFGLASVRARLAGADHVVFFHFLTEGGCKVRLAGSAVPLDVAAGDLVLFPQEDKHLMGSDLQLAPVETASLIRADAATDTEFIQMRHGGGGAATRFVCGYLACSRSVCRPLLDALPRLLRIPIGDGPAAALLRELLRVGVRESSASRPGAESMLAKLSELMFVEAMRRYVEELPRRLHLRGLSLGGRWRELAGRWAGKTLSGCFPFNDLHALVAFIGAGNPGRVEQSLQTLRRRAAAGGPGAQRIRDISLPIAEAFAAFGSEDYGAAIEGFSRIRVMDQLGGSHAQQDAIHLTLIEAALRHRHFRLARALAAERTALKPGSAFNRALSRRAEAVFGLAA